MRRRPAAITRCVADRYHSTGERIVEVAFPSGKGCLISLTERPCPDGTLMTRVDVYQQDREVDIVVGQPRVTA